MSRRQRQRFFGLAAAAVAFAGVSSSANAQTTVGTYSSSADLDLTGTFAYVLDIGGDGNSRMVGGLTFIDDEGTPGVSAQSEHNNFGYQSPNYDGGGTSEDNLEAISNTIRWSANDAVGLDDVLVDLAVTPGNQYKLQLLFQDDPRGSGGRGFDVEAEGATIVDNFGSSSGNLTSGTLITHTFTAADDTFNLVLDGSDAAGGTFSDLNAILSALTLEVVPEPGTLSVLALAAPALLGRRRR